LQSLSKIVEPQGIAIESRKKNKNKNKNSGDDSTNDNNVYIPEMPNQVSKNEQQKQRQRHFQENSSAKSSVPSESHKAQSVVVSDVFANEKPQVAESALEMDRKALVHIEKLCQYLERLQDIIKDPPHLEDMTDLNKRKQRAFEFTNRFARNHLYQIGRMVRMSSKSKKKK
jgi:hypothetical protein